MGVKLKYEMLLWRTNCPLELGRAAAVSACVGVCLHRRVNEEVISGVNAWQRAKRWPLQGGNRGEEGKDYKNQNTVRSRRRQKSGKLSERREVERTAEQRAGRVVEWYGSLMRTIRLTALTRDFTESSKDHKNDFKLPTVFSLTYRQITSVS